MTAFFVPKIQRTSSNTTRHPITNRLVYDFSTVLQSMPNELSAPTEVFDSARSRLEFRNSK